MRKHLLLLVLLLLCLAQVFGDEPTSEPTSQPSQIEKKHAPTSQKSDAPVVTEHELNLPNTSFKYKTTAGFIPLKDAKEKPRAKVFFMAYVRSLDDDAALKDRPITFVFNGGPGAASVWLHLGAAGPMRVALPENGFPPAPPYRLTENAQTWLGFTDLVFIDPVGTGFSRAEPDHAKEFYNVEGDISSVAEVIRLYLTQYDRWPRPKFVAGESYGTTR